MKIDIRAKLGKFEKRVKSFLDRQISFAEKYSSEMRTARFSGHLGDVCLGGVCPWGVSAQGRVYPGGMDTPLDPEADTPHCMLGYIPPPPVDRRNDTRL